MKTKLTYLTVLCGFCLSLISMATPEKEGYAWLKQRLDNTKAYTLAVLKVMPADDYGFKPNEDQRSFGAQAYHIAYSVDYFERALANKGQAAWSPGDENSKNKDELIKWTEQKFDSMHKMILATEASDMMTEQIISYLDHNAHHRGQMITYLRMKGITPPQYR